MKTTDLEKYIGSLLNTSEVDRKILEEIFNSKLILTAYRLGLEGKEFYSDLLVTELDLEKEIPVEYHILVAQIACIRSKKVESMAMGYLIKNTQKLLKDFRNYFTEQEKK